MTSGEKPALKLNTINNIAFIICINFFFTKKKINLLFLFQEKKKDMKSSRSCGQASSRTSSKSDSDDEKAQTDVSLKVNTFNNNFFLIHTFSF